MAIVVVGDIDPAYAEAKIKEHFTKMTGPKEERERINFTIPENNEPLVAIATDKEATSTMAVIIRKLPKFKVETNDEYRTMLKLDLYLAILNERLFEITQDPEAPFMYSASDYGGFLARSLDAFTMFAAVKDNRISDAISTMIVENKRVKRYGFTAAELDRQKAEVLSNFEKALEEKDKTESRNYVSEYVSNFLDQEPFPGIDYEAELVKKLIPGITLDEVNQMAYYIGKINNLIILVTAPDKEEVVIPTQDEILAAISTAQNSEIIEYKEEAIHESLITGVITAGTVTNKSIDEDFGLTTLDLSNGVRVILKPTNFKNDEILMNAYSFGGTSLAPEADFISVSFAGQIMSMSGLGEFDNIELKKFLTGKNVSVNTDLGTLSEGLRGKSVKKDLETMFQLIHLNFTQPRKDTTAFKTFKSTMLSQFQFMMANPQAVFYDTLYKLATQNDPRTIVIPTEKQINSISLDVAYDFYKNRFANANGFTFVFVGSFDVDKITPLITKYIGSLPSTGETETWKDVSPEFPKGITDVVVYKGTEPKSTVAIMMDQNFEWNSSSRLEMSMLMKILNIRMRESMREEQGGVYGVRARPTISKYPNEEVNIMISWGCAPENVDQLVKTVFAEMDTLQMNGPTEINLGKAKETTIRDYESNFEKNSYWLNKIKYNYYNGDKLKSLETLTKTVHDVSNEDLRKMAKKYFTDDHYLKVIMMPEE
jgi:zinc protease